MNEEKINKLINKKVVLKLNTSKEVKTFVGYITKNLLRDNHRFVDDNFQVYEFTEDFSSAKTFLFSPILVKSVRLYNLIDELMGVGRRNE
jgi:hypothetical protein